MRVGPVLTMDSSRRTAPAPTVAALLLLAVLTGCAGTAQGSADSTRTPAAATAPSVTATPTPAADAADPSTWLVDSSGIGPMLLDAELAASTSGLTEYTADDPAQCGNPERRVYSSPTLPTLWIGISTSSPTTIVSVSIGGDLPDATRAAASPKTSDGIAIGSSEADVVAAYPQATMIAQGSVVFYEIGEVSGAHVEIATFNGIVQTISVLSTPYPLTEFCG